MARGLAVGIENSHTRLQQEFLQHRLIARSPEQAAKTKRASNGIPPESADTGRGCSRSFVLRSAVEFTVLLEYLRARRSRSGSEPRGRR